MIALLALAGCGVDTAGTATRNPAAAIPSPGTPGPPPGTDPAGKTPATSPPSATGQATGGPVSTAPATPPTDLTGEVHGFITAVDVPGATLTVDKIDWFTGAAARQACAEDGVTDTSNNWCTGYYWRNRNPALRTVAVDPDATITVLDGSASVPGSLARVAERITQASSTYLLVVRDGRVTEVHESYAP